MKYPTANEIEAHRKFLDDNWRQTKARDEGRRISLTSTQPCQGCGEVSRYRRITDRVCNECRNLIRDGLKVVEKLLTDVSRKLYYVKPCGYFEGRKLYRTGWVHDEANRKDLIAAMNREERPLPPGEVIEEMMKRLVKALSAELPHKDWLSSYNTSSREALYVEDKHSSGYDSSEAFLEPEHALILRTLDVAIRKALIERSLAGEEYGRNLLAQLASGELSITKFNELSNPQINSKSTKGN